MSGVPLEMMNSTFTNLQVSNALENSDFDKQVSDAHLNDFSTNCCSEDWKLLCPHLKLNGVVAEDIDREPLSPKLKRKSFFGKWKQEKGSDATYRVLVCALLRINHRQDAEYLCKLLKNSMQTVTITAITTATAASATISSTSMPALQGIFRLGYW